jgi:predicted dehydrogenase
VVALADTSRDRVDSLGARFGVQARYTSAGALIEDPAVEVVGILTPAASHAEALTAALAAGKPTLVERPLALGLDDAQLVRRRARESGTAVGVAFNLRAHRHVVRARELIARGIVGRVEAVQSVVRGPLSAGAGALFEKGCDHFDLWRLLAGAEAGDVTAVSRAADGGGEIAAVCAAMQGGAIASGLFADCPGTANRITVHGPGGQLDISMLEHDGLRFVPSSRYPGDVRVRLARLATTVGGLPRALRPIAQGGDYRMSYGRQWEGFLTSLRAGSPPDATLEDGLRALEIALAAARSGALGRAVGISEIGDAPAPGRAAADAARSSISSR